MLNVKKVCLLILCALLLLSSLNTLPVNARTWTVDDGGTADFSSIQEAINAADPGDTVFVYNGTYYEDVVVNKTVSLIGEERETTILDGGGESLSIIRIVADDVVVEGFTVQNTTSGGTSYGIQVWRSQNTSLRNNIAEDCWHGIVLTDSNSSRIMGNSVIHSTGTGIDLQNANDNLIIGNSIIENPTGISISRSSLGNVLYRNNFINNTMQIAPSASAVWDNGAEGNYWSDYNGDDDGSGGRDAGDGIGDTEVPHLLDDHPLIDPWNETRTYPFPPHDDVIVKCNYTVASFTFDNMSRQIQFYITGPSGWSGYCNVTIPIGLLSPNATEQWIVKLGLDSLAYTDKSVDTSILISFNYTLSSSMFENGVWIKVGTLFPPTASFEFAPDPASIIEPVIFNASESSDPGGSISEYNWDFGDGNVTDTDNPIVTHRFEHARVYDVTLTVIDNDGQEGSVTRQVGVGKGITTMEIYAPEEVVKVGDLFVVQATLRDATRLLGGEQIEFYIYSNGSLVRSEPGTTSDMGKATEFFTLTTGGEYSVRAEFGGSTDYFGSNVTLSITVNRLNTNLTLRIPENIVVDKEFTVFATLLNEYEQPVFNATVEFFFHNGSTWEPLGSSKTDRNGAASLAYVPQHVGQFELKAMFHGDEAHAAASFERSFTVLAPETDYVPYIVLAFLTVGMICLVYLALKRRRHS